MNQDLVIFVYFGIGVILHFLIAVDVLFPRKSRETVLWANFDCLFDSIWILLVATWPIWMLVLTIIWFSSRR